MADLKPTTAEEQKAALDTLIRMALTNQQGHPMAELQTMLGTLPAPAGKRVADILIILAGYAVPDDDEWRGVLEHFLTRVAMSEEAAVSHFGELPEPAAGETQDEANARVLRASHAAGWPLPDVGTALGDWVRQDGRITQIGPAVQP